jgi:hypothetical protein
MVAPPAAADGLLPPPVEQALIASASSDAPRASLRYGRIWVSSLVTARRAAREESVDHDTRAPRSDRMT